MIQLNEIPDGWTNSTDTSIINNTSIQLLYLVNKEQTAEIMMRVIDVSSAVDKYGYRKYNLNAQFIDLSSYLKDRAKYLSNDFMESYGDELGNVNVEIGEVKTVKLGKKKGKAIIMREEMGVSNIENYALLPEKIREMIKRSTAANSKIEKLTLENMTTIYLFKVKGKLLYIETNTVNEEGENQVEEALDRLK